MRRHLRGYKAFLAFVASALLVVTGSQMVCAQGTLTAELLPQGGVSVMAGGKLLALFSLSAHGPEWKHADQPQATATVREADPGPGEVVEGTLPVPSTDGGAVKFVETVIPRDRGFSADCILGVTQALTLNGLQVSLLLPTDRFAGKTIVVHGPPAGAEAAAEEPVSLTVPGRLDEEKWQLFAGPASKIEIAAGTDDSITIAPRPPEAKKGEVAAPTTFLVQDLRKWDQDMIEVRLYLIMEDKGKQVAVEDKLHAALDLIFARELQWQERPR
jgi:hypothetical protein